MKRYDARLWAAAAMAAGGTWLAAGMAAGQQEAWDWQAQEPTAPLVTDPWDDFMDRWVLDRLEVGARVHHFRLRDTRRTGPNGYYDNWNLRGNFIGSVWGLDEKQEYLPRLHAQYRIWRGVGVGLTYDKIVAETVDWSSEEGVTSTDGDVIIEGPLAYAFWRYENRTRFTPGVELGLASYSASFDVNPAWAAVGPGYRFEVDDTDGYYLALNCDVELGERWLIDFHYRRMFDAEVDARAYFSRGTRVGRYGAFPMEYAMFGIGATYRF